MPAYIFGTPADDTIPGTAGDDYIDGGAGADRMSGGTGNDIYVVENILDVIDELAGEGQDRIYAKINFILAAGVSVEELMISDINEFLAVDLTGNELTNNLWGNASANRLDGAAGDDALAGFGGDDFLIGGDGGDSLDGGDGNDNLSGGSGFDTLLGGAGNDFLDGGAGGQTGGRLLGGTGDDTYIFRDGDFVTESAGEGFDRLYTTTSITLGAGSNQDFEVLSAYDISSETSLTLGGNQIDNNIWGNAGANSISGGGGNDSLFGFDGADSVTGDDGNDFIDGGRGRDSMFGGSGNDILVVDDSTEMAWGQAGTDLVYTSVDYELAFNGGVEILAAGDRAATVSMTLTGDSFDNSIWGNDGGNVIDGGASVGSDNLFGFGGNDTLRGQGGTDFLVGGNDDDTLDGGPGADRLLGEAGADVFHFHSSLGPSNIDTVFDFSSGTDKISLLQSVFTEVPTTGLPAGAFVLGTAAGDADDRIIYDQSLGALYYDPDGNGAATQVQFAYLANLGPVVASDFLI